MVKFKKFSQDVNLKFMCFEFYYIENTFEIEKKNCKMQDSGKNYIKINYKNVIPYCGIKTEILN